MTDWITNKIDYFKAIANENLFAFGAGPAMFKYSMRMDQEAGYDPISVNIPGTDFKIDLPSFGPSQQEALFDIGINFVPIGKILPIKTATSLISKSTAVTKCTENLFKATFKGLPNAPKLLPGNNKWGLNHIVRRHGFDSTKKIHLNLQPVWVKMRFLLQYEKELIDLDVGSVNQINIIQQLLIWVEK